MKDFPHRKQATKAWVGGLAMAIALCGCCHTNDSQETKSIFSQTSQNDLPPEHWGIEVASLRLSANGYLVDFRYKVTDASKASRLGAKEIKPYLLDEATGVKLWVPNAPKLGPLRANAKQTIAGRTCFVLFSNRGKIVQPGSKVTVVIGQFEARHLTVQQ